MGPTTSNSLVDEVDRPFYDHFSFIVIVVIPAAVTHCGMA